MNNLLLSKRPKDSDKDEFIKAWNNSQYVLECLADVLKDLMEQNNKVNKDDFDCPNHYAKLAFQAGENKAYAFILSLMPLDQRK